ncbi:oxidoreductase [Gemmatimonadetes bacterium T265]|nr:oxidoreductase [Gemmatimonadetes bacterium T265]
MAAGTSGITGKVVAVTGASSGIGAATARLLAERGATVVLGATGAARLEAVAREIAAHGHAVAHRATDVRRRTDLAALVALATERFGRLDVLVASAGVAPTGPLDALAVDDWDAMIDVNLRGVLYGIAAALPVFRHQQSGHFVTIVSTAGLRVVPGQAVYAGTKNAVRTILEGLRQESKGEFRVTGVSPGFVRTNLADSMRDPGTAAQVRDRMAAIGLPPEAVARAVAFAIEQPAEVDVGDVVVRPAAQD